MRKLAMALLVLVAGAAQACAQSNGPSAASAEASRASVEASRASVEAVGSGIAAVVTLVMIPPMAVAEFGTAVADSARNAPLPLGEGAVTVGPAPDLAVQQ